MHSTSLRLVEMGKMDIHLMAKVCVIKTIRKKLIKFKYQKNQSFSNKSNKTNTYLEQINVPWFCTFIPKNKYRFITVDFGYKSWKLVRKHGEIYEVNEFS